MKSTMKFALSLLIGASVFTLTACDNQESKTQEKTTALSETKVEATAEKATELTAKKEESVSADSKENKENNAEDVSNKPQSEVAKVEEMKTPAQPAAAEKKTNEAVEQPVQPAVKTVKTATQKAQSVYLSEQKALLKALESQYQQVRCTPEAEKLGDYSFCRQEERRLFLEIERVKDEIRLNQ